LLIFALNKKEMSRPKFVLVAVLFIGTSLMMSCRSRKHVDCPAYGKNTVQSVNKQS